MPRIPYVYPEPGQCPVADKIRARRKDGKLIALDAMFLNAPVIAAGYNSLLGAVRLENSLDGGLRELLILRVAALNSAAYEWIAHEPIAREAGLTDEQIAAIRDVSNARSIPRTVPIPALPPLFAAAMAYTDAMTLDVKVTQEVFDALRLHLNDQKMMEVTATVASYNMVSRVLVAMDVGDMADREVPKQDSSSSNDLGPIPL